MNGHCLESNTRPSNLSDLVLTPVTTGRHIPQLTHARTHKSLLTVCPGVPRLRTVYCEVSMPWDWPVEVNYHEARAYCAWKGPDYRLPTEAEHNVLRGIQVGINSGEHR